GAPTLAPGGGAEVLPAGYLGTNPLAASWFANAAMSRPHDDLCVVPVCALYALFSQPLTPRSSSTAACAQYNLVPYVSPKPTYPPSAPSLDYLESDARHSPLPATVYPYMASNQMSSSAAAPSMPTPVPTSMPLALPSALGLPVYSSSGLDLLSLLARVVNRPNPRIILGPVDMTCSFVVVDARRYDSPIVYASPTFCSLTGYAEHEVVGKNCRFLQAPDGCVNRGEPRHYTAPEAVAQLRRSISAHKECQASIINYRKGGAAFINLVTVIPVPDDTLDEPRFYVGFQVDLAQQPAAILQKLRDGSYIVNYSDSSPSLSYSPRGPRDWRTSATAMPGVSPALRTLLADPAFLSSFQFYIGSSAVVTSPTGERVDPYDGNQPMHLALLEAAPDFIHVVSLKGAFLYVAPAVRDVLGYVPAELVGRAIVDVCHPADVVPLMRELKESSVTHGPGSSAGTAAAATAPPAPGGRPRTVDLLFRMRAKSGEFVWLECRGRLHVEPGKGRKAIILSGRVRSMPRLTWRAVARAGGLASPAPTSSLTPALDDDEHVEQERECWALLSPHGTVLFAGAAVRDVLGWGAGEVIGRAVSGFLGGPGAAEVRGRVEEVLLRVSGGVVSTAASDTPYSIPCELQRKDGTLVSAQTIIYSLRDGPGPSSLAATAPMSCPVVCQIRLVGPAGAQISTARILHALGESVFDELQISRGSSWQYELQQLKFANQRLQEEIAAIEGSLR
ncbi:hypothetical protein OBBRIDRAFT_703984, partial [Obba rivulosa]